MDVEDWKPAFCTMCDKQCLGVDVYCSDKCRLLDESKQSTRLSVSPKHSRDSNILTGESDEDCEVPNMWLSVPEQELPKKKLSPDHKNKNSDKTFLYASPALIPSKVPKAPLSPFLMPQDMGAEPVLPQSVNTYRRWLADSTV